MTARVLIVEDNQVNLELMVYLLNAAGYATLSASDGERGWDAACRETPDLIVSDVHMPGMDGYELARKLKAHATLREIPLVAVTAFAMVGDRDKAFAAGFDGYLTKPIDPARFISQLAEFLPAEAHPAVRQGP